jgi:hypothetical protein
MRRVRIESKKAKNGWLALGRLISLGFRKEAPVGNFMRGLHFSHCPSHISTPSRRCFYLAIQIAHPTSTLRYDISRLRTGASHVGVHAVYMRPRTVDPSWSRQAVAHATTLNAAERADLAGRLVATSRMVSAWPAERKRPRLASTVRRRGTTTCRFSTGILGRTCPMVTGTRACSFGPRSALN